MMRKLQYILFLSIALGGLISAPVFAQEILEISPSQIVVNTVRQQTVSRMLLIRTDQDVIDITIIPLDLKDADGSKVLPAEAMRIESESDALDSNGLLTVMVHIDLQNVASGQYTGELLVSVNNDSRQVPITVTVKDPPYIAAAVLAAGVGLGLAVSEYRSKGKPRDEILVNLGQIRTQIKVDEELQNKGSAFYNRIQAELVDVEVALEAQQWEQATSSIDKARTVWNSWRRGRSDWIVQLKAHNKLRNKLKDLGGLNIHFIANLMQSANDTYRKTPTFKGPEELREQLVSLYESTNTYVEIKHSIDELAAMGPGSRRQAQLFQSELDALTPDKDAEQNALKQNINAAVDKVKRQKLKDQLAWLDKTCRELPAGVSGDWTDKVQDLQQAYNNLSADDQKAYLDLMGRVDAAILEIQALASVQPVEDEGISPEFEMSTTGTLIRGEKLTNVPDITLRSIATQVVSAGARLRVFTLITYSVAVILLTLAGYVELYATRSDFGSNSIADYFGLLAWGFGAEATRAAIADMVNSWGIVRK
jgi:hypothetical protein